MFVSLIFLLIFTGSADSVTTAAMPTGMPTQSPPDDLMPTQSPPDDLMPTQSPPDDLMPTQSPPDDLMPTQSPPDDLNQTEGEVSGEQVCSFLDVVVHLDLREDNRNYTATRPVLNHTKTTVVTMDVYLIAILDLVEKDLKFVSHMYIGMSWKNEHISWDPSKFCGIEEITVPHHWMWEPDIIIEERLEMDKVVLNPYVSLSSNGTVWSVNKEVVVSSCRMNVYKFPFDTQSCNLTFASGIYWDPNELRLEAFMDSDFTRLWTFLSLRDEFDWMFDNFSYTVYNESAFRDHRIVYTITMKRKAVLYIVNFLLPVLCFLGLDMASFLISDSEGEKLGFKVTVLLAVTVLQLILNEILPATSNRLPIIAMYCMGSFSLMLLSLLETILVTYLLEKDSSVPQKTDTDNDHNEKEDKTKEKRRKWCPCFYDVPEEGDREATHQPLNAAEEDGDLKGESNGFQVILDELRDLEKNLGVFFKSNKEDGGRPGYWATMATRINKAFFMFYVTTVVVFLAVIFNEWSPEY